ncbi:Glucosyl-3-phosphoglycerate/mannosyl-3-phosphoglycerate phosphatase [BD1-7 clade bacterium]|uniref:Glucosyl-3-phosphoglycerate/mannosyl-3-phosphogly cerate phosphatase n=1 Tax=BD1-7 clade bacterium TaxID=2029982 RepID=A0A5S9P293_9GAMM|nr:Glucosyl-3-phosphoglycerate/mannosyl-3-phosphoglycerate phosphatase [BD1-7 clade bacterium]CAA0116526.1 Glucosyl-3-phosphoglycerate/mannosyl-3-phosphoglycerate phosphatase [BD1-7 clade bacterium]CAA0120149.1 Glucosyl-3-phosphoglycerate/mannosyl-3-phosphoglycerate phosphatase [BD1-7 clade bacterium]
MKQKLLIFTDLDGSLLDHDTYSAEPALPLLHELQAQGHKIIPTTSKTEPEVRHLQKSLGNKAPFVVENGAAAFLPADEFADFRDSLPIDGFYHQSFCQEANHWRRLIDSLATPFTGCFRRFSTFTTDEIMAATGLDKASAVRAAERQYGEPVQWFGDEKAKIRFAAALINQGANVLEGGRFLHVSGKVSKGRALQWLEAAYSVREPETVFTTIAIGDSKNDVAMLEAADYALVIKSPVHPPPEIKREDSVFYSTLCGPAGWAEGMQSIITTINDEAARETI